MEFTQTLLNCQPSTFHNDYGELQTFFFAPSAPRRRASAKSLCPACAMLAHRARRAAAFLQYSSAKQVDSVHTRARGVALDCTIRACMPGRSSAATPDPVSEFRVEKSRAKATLILSNGMSVHGSFFISGDSRTHAGPESVRDLLNSETGFFPFDACRFEETTTILYNRDHLVFIELKDKGEPCRDPGYDVRRKDRPRC